MTPDRTVLRQKALLAAASVVLAMGSGCTAGTHLSDSATIAAAGSEEPDCTAVAAEDLSACCQDRSAWCDATHMTDAGASECTFGPGYDGSTGCIPWGPPVPPRFSGAVA